jgi:hypothetical protein
VRICGSIAIVVLVGAISSSAMAQEKLSFNRDIRPILSKNCFACHGRDAKHRKGKLRLDTLEGSRAKAESKAVAIVPGDLKKSELVFRISTKDPEDIMPPPKSHKKLTAVEIATLRKWVEQGGSYEAYWAYASPTKLALPKVSDGGWSKNWIDPWIFNRLKAGNLKPSPEADRRTLVRRLSFDLAGLPPTPKEVDAFVSSKEPDAYEKLVDRLLASPRFGERMAMYWLDLVRYADTVGYHGDQDHSISPYRDWVIKAYNANMPFNQFVTEQLAGDLLPNATLDQKVATGYNRLLQTSHEGGVQPQEYLAIYAADRIRNFSNVYMGATVGCAQCHDHKYDPYTAKDFYSLVAYFADIDEAQHFKNGSNSLPTRRTPEIVVPDDPKNPKKGRKTMITVAIKPRVIRILPRGNWLDETGPVVQPATPAFLPMRKVAGRPTRLDLAKWLSAEVGGLTARVQVNRLWYLLLGSGISRSLDDFGGQGEPAFHPELLDQLALEFRSNGWNIKKTMRLIATSATYRQSSVSTEAIRRSDPYNQFVSHQSNHRLDAEMIRDSALLVGGLLVEQVGGASVKPYQPAGYYRHLNFPRRGYKHHTDQRQWRRGVYMHWQRQFLHPMLKAFDAPSREECTAQRPRSNTPLGALVLLNDPTFVEASRALAVRVLAEGGKTSTTRIDRLFKLVLSRKPTSTEASVLKGFVAKQLAQYRADAKAATALVSVGQSAPPKGVRVSDLAAWTSAARVVLNLDEAITRK